MRTAILKGLSSLYRSVMSVRNRLYGRGVLDSYRSTLPVVSIGNVTAGGNGKTPLALFLLRELRARGFSPVLLSRGYGGRLKGPLRVTDEHLASEVGDEPLLLHRRSGVPVYVSRRRAAGARLIEADVSGDVIVLDDAFQHRALARDLDIVSVFVGSPTSVAKFVAGDLLPFGLFREDRDEALSRADLIVLSERKVFLSGEPLPQLDPRILKVLPGDVPVYRSFLESKGVIYFGTHTPVTPQRIIAFAAIAHPEGFYESLEKLGFTVVERASFPDHHSVSDRDLHPLFASNPGCIAVCTEKDEVKCQTLSADVRSSLAVLRTEPRVSPADAFLVAVERSLQARS